MGDLENSKINDLRTHVDHMFTEQHDARKRFDEMQKALYTLAEAQKNTTKNIDKISEDIRVLVKNAYEFQVLEISLSDLSKRCEILESSKQWGFRLVVGAVIMSLISFILDLKVHL